MPPSADAWCRCGSTALRDGRRERASRRCTAGWRAVLPASGRLPAVAVPPAATVSPRVLCCPALGCLSCRVVSLCSCAPAAPQLSPPSPVGARQCCTACCAPAAVPAWLTCRAACFGSCGWTDGPHLCWPVPPAVCSRICCPFPAFVSLQFPEKNNQLPLYASPPSSGFAATPAPPPFPRRPSGTPLRAGCRWGRQPLPAPSPVPARSLARSQPPCVVWWLPCSKLPPSSRV